MNRPASDSNNMQAAETIKRLNEIILSGEKVWYPEEFEVKASPLHTKTNRQPAVASLISFSGLLFGKCIDIGQEAFNQNFFVKDILTALLLLAVVIFCIVGIAADKKNCKREIKVSGDSIFIGGKDYRADELDGIIGNISGIAICAGGKRIAPIGKLYEGLPELISWARDKDLKVSDSMADPKTSNKQVALFMITVLIITIATILLLN